MTIDEQKAISQFEKFLRDTIPPHGNLTIEADGEIHRYHIDGDRTGTKNGAYLLHLDGRPAGYVQNWKTGEEITWKYELTAEEKFEYAKEVKNGKVNIQRITQAQAQKKEERAKLHDEKQVQAIARLQAEYQHSRGFSHETGLIQHPYWWGKFGTLQGMYYGYLSLHTNTNKFPIVRVLTPYDGGICEAGEILVPMVNIETGELQSLIRIFTKPGKNGKFDKRNYDGAPQSGVGHWVISPTSARTDVILVCEGITTAIAVAIMSFLEGRKDAVLSVGSCENLKSACEALRKRYSESIIVIMADNDKPDSKDKNAGLDAANKCAELGLADKVKPSPVQGQDWYDYLHDFFSRKVEANIDV